MKKIIAMSGVSGVGKTWARTHDADLKELPQLDIMDVYREYPGISPTGAFSQFIGKVQTLINRNDCIVLEAYFRQGSRQRILLEWTAETVGATIEYRELHAPLDVCKARVKAQAIELFKDFPDDPFVKDYTDTRLRLLDMMEA